MMEKQTMRKTSSKTKFHTVTLLHLFVFQQYVSTQVLMTFYNIYSTIRDNYKKLPFLLLGKYGHFFIDPQKLNEEENLQQFSFQGLYSVTQPVTHRHTQKVATSYAVQNHFLWQERKVFGSDMVLQ